MCNLQAFKQTELGFSSCMCASWHKFFKFKFEGSARVFEGLNSMTNSQLLPSAAALFPSVVTVALCLDLKETEMSQG